jgi:hypothetical protein
MDARETTPHGSLAHAPEIAVLGSTKGKGGHPTD